MGFFYWILFLKVIEYKLISSLIDLLDKTLDKKSSVYYDDLSSISTDRSISRLSINDFQMIDSTASNNSNLTDNSCVISTRTIFDEERPILESISKNNCSTPKHVLCETKTLIIQNYQTGCFFKPLTLDLPTLISNHLTHELCSSVCRELETSFAIIHMDKCHCLEGSFSKAINFQTDFQKYERKNCGNPCSGMFSKSIKK